jgi:hypothetical protein
VAGAAEGGREVVESSSGHDREGWYGPLQKICNI